MKLLNSLFFTLCLSFVIISCQQPVDDNFPNPNPTGDSTILSRLVVTDTTLAPGLDTLGEWKWDYDNAGRVKSVRLLLREETSTSPAYTVDHNYRFSYNGNDTLPFKLTGVIYDHSVPVLWDTVYLYYQNGMITKDSSRIKQIQTGGTISDGVTLNLYVNTGPNTITQYNRLFGFNPDGTLSAPCETISVHVNTITNGNITRQDETRTGCTVFIPPGVLHSVTDFVYDNKVNPLASVSLPWPVFTDDFFFVVPSRGQCQKNNLLSIDNLGIYDYKFNSLGYPVSVRFIVAAGGVPDHSKGIYFYTK